MNTLKLPTAEEMGLTEDEYNNLLIDWWKAMNFVDQTAFQYLYDANLNIRPKDQSLI